MMNLGLISSNNIMQSYAIILDFLIKFLEANDNLIKSFIPQYIFEVVKSDLEVSTASEDLFFIHQIGFVVLNGYVLT